MTFSTPATYTWSPACAKATATTCHKLPLLGHYQNVLLTSACCLRCVSARSSARGAGNCKEAWVSKLAGAQKTGF